MACAESMIKQWSKQRALPTANNCKPFIQRPSHRHMDWCAAYSWLRNKPKILITATENPVYFVAASGQDDTTENMAGTYV